LPWRAASPRRKSFASSYESPPLRQISGWTGMVPASNFQGDDYAADGADPGRTREPENQASRGRGRRVPRGSGEGVGADVSDDAGGGLAPPAVAGLRLPPGDAGSADPQ